MVFEFFVKNFIGNLDLLYVMIKYILLTRNFNNHPSNQKCLIFFYYKTWKINMILQTNNIHCLNFEEFLTNDVLSTELSSKFNLNLA